MCMTCVRHVFAMHGGALWWASVELKHDREVVIEAVTQHVRVLRFASELKGDREVVVEAVRQHGRALRYASEELYARQGSRDRGHQAEWWCTLV